MPVTKRKRTAATAKATTGSVFEFADPFIKRCGEIRDGSPVLYEMYLQEHHEDEFGCHPRGDIPLDLIEGRIGYRLQQRGYEKQCVKVPDYVQERQNQIESEIEIMMAKPEGKKRPAKKATAKGGSERKPRAGATRYLLGILAENNAKKKTDAQISAQASAKFPENVASPRISNIKTLRRRYNRGVGVPSKPKESILEWGKDGLPIEDKKEISAKWAKGKSPAPVPRVGKWGGVKEEKPKPAKKIKKATKTKKVKK